jgi:hypothetical protein
MHVTLPGQLRIDTDSQPNRWLQDRTDRKFTAMARQLIEQITDDLDGSKADASVRFAWNGENYEIDLSKKNFAAFAKAMKPYLEAARKVKPSARGGRRSRVNGTTSRKGVVSDLAAIREWAKQNGHTVADRGRIPQAVLLAYAAR